MNEIELPRTRPVQTRSGFVMCINYRETPPPESGILRCMYCGHDKEHITDEPYEYQMRHEDCPTGMTNCQSYMSGGWRGWNHQSHPDYIKPASATPGEMSADPVEIPF